MKTVQPKSKDEFLGRYGPASKPATDLVLPGLDGPRPHLNIVLQILLGRVEGIVETLLPFENQIRSSPDTLGSLLAQTNSVSLIQTQMVSIMRRMVRLWIDSGKDSAYPGYDAPAQRNVLFARNEDSPTIHQYLTGRLFDRHPRFMRITSKGKLGVSDTFPHINPHPLYYTYDATSLEDWGERLALFFFAQFLDSPYSLHLSFCDDCGEFFAYERVRLGIVKNGVHCVRCKPSDSVKRTKSRREALTSRMINAAAKARISWEKSASSPDLDQWVLQQVNAEFATALGKLKSKRWLAQHRNAILERVQRRTDAKG